MEDFSFALNMSQLKHSDTIPMIYDNVQHGMIAYIFSNVRILWNFVMLTYVGK